MDETHDPSPEEGLVVILPELSPDSATHYAHYLPLLRELSSLTRLALVVERGDAADEPRLAELLPEVLVRVQRKRRPVPRALELMRLMVSLNRKGFKCAYGSYSPYYGVAGAITGRMCGTRISYWHCRSDFFDRRISRRLTPVRVLTDTLPFVLSLHLADRVITGTEGLADLYARTFRLRRAKVRVVPNDVDISAFRPRAGPPLDRKPLTALFVGRLSEHKGARLLPSIALALHDAIPAVRLVIAGGGPDEAWVRSGLAELERRGAVQLLGYVPNHRVRALMQEADILLMPVLSEGFPRWVLEAMASGLPFVTTDVGGVAEVVPELARRQLLPAGDVDGMVGRAQALLEQSELRRELAEAGLAHVGRFAVERVAPVFLREVCGS